MAASASESESTPGLLHLHGCEAFGAGDHFGSAALAADRDAFVRVLHAVAALEP